MTTLRRDPVRRVVAEFLGTLLLLVAVVGSGIATSTDGAASTQLFQHAAVVGATLVVLVMALGPVSGAHFNPAVTLAAVVLDLLPGRLAVPYVAAQVAGAITGTVVANTMFGLAPVALGTTGRTGATLWGSEVVATAGLVAIIFGMVRAGSDHAVPAAVGGWVFGAVFFTSSTCFANPAVTVGRLFTDSWTAIDPAHVPAYVAAQVVGSLLAVGLVAWLWSPGPAAGPGDTVPAAVPDPARADPPTADPGHRGPNTIDPTHADAAAATRR